MNWGTSVVTSCNHMDTFFHGNVGRAIVYPCSCRYLTRNKPKETQSPIYETDSTSRDRYKQPCHEKEKKEKPKIYVQRRKRGSQ